MDNLIGKTLDGLYTIQELIGAGGMANVYKAVVSAPGGPVPEGTVVAVKVLRQELMHDATPTSSAASRTSPRPSPCSTTPTSSRSTTSPSAKTYSISSWSAWRA